MSNKQKKKPSSTAAASSSEAKKTSSTKPSTRTPPKPKGPSTNVRRPKGSANGKLKPGRKTVPTRGSKNSSRSARVGNGSIEKEQGNGVNYNTLYNKYYSASDFRFYIGDILVDKASGIGITESLSSVPLYTVGNSRFAFLSRGNNIVHGYISVNKCTRGYLARILNAVQEHSDFKSLSPYEQMQLTPQELKIYKEKEDKFDRRQVAEHSILDWSDYDLFSIRMVYDNSDVTTSGVKQSAVISEIRIIGYEQSVDVGSDGNLIDGYRFVAKEIRQG